MVIRTIRAKPEIHRPVSNLFIVTSVLVALFLNGLPWSGVGLFLRPDFVALVMLYWCTHKPMRVGIGLFGQHALAYSVLAFGGIVLHRRLQMFDLRQQTIQVFGIFAMTYGVYALLNWQVSGYVVWPYFLGCLTSTLLWMPLSIMLREIGQMKADRNRT